MLEIIFASNLLSALIRLWPLILFRLGLPRLQVFLINSRGLLVGKLGFLGTAKKDLGMDLFIKIKILPCEYLFTLISKTWEASNLVTFSV